MGAPLTEFVIETVIRDGLNELRVNPDRFDDLFSRFNEAHFGNQYGQAKIDELKTYIQNNQIKIVHAYNVQPTQMPCISIQMISSDEVEELQQFSNELEEVDSDKTPDVYVSDIQPLSYDTVTGKLSIENGADLSMICPGMIFVDADGVEFVIGVGNSNMSGMKFINIGKGKEPSLALGARIESQIDFTRTRRRQIRLMETISLGCHASNNLHLSKFLYYILVYIIKSRQDAMINRGLQLDRSDASIFDRQSEFEGEHIFSRYINIHVMTEFDWDQEEVNIVDCFDVDVLACDGNEVVDPNPSDGSD